MQYKEAYAEGMQAMQAFGSIRESLRDGKTAHALMRVYAGGGMAVVRCGM